MDEQDELMHFGVKGQRWGVRNASKPVSPKMSKTHDPLRGDLMTKADAKWVKKARNFRKGIEAYNQAADAMNNTHIPRINNKPEYKGVNLMKNPKVMAKYNAEYKKVFEDEFNKALSDVYGSSPSGKYKVISEGPDDLAWRLAYTDDKVKHADNNEFSLDLEVRRDNFGHILEFKVRGDALAQSDVDSYLAHFGVKGMRWGVRNDRSSSKAANASEDAKRATAAKEKMKKTGQASLSNKEMQDLVTRLNLEKQLSTLTTPKKSKFQKNVDEALNNAMKNSMNQAAKAATGLLIKQAFELYKKKK